ncbi:MAG: hypothetical protein ACE5FD_18820, partial [Anaerolineae bacterium]
MVIAFKQIARYVMILLRQTGPAQLQYVPVPVAVRRRRLPRPWQLTVLMLLLARLFIAACSSRPAAPTPPPLEPVTQQLQ